MNPKTEEVLGILLANTYQLWPGGGYYRALPHYVDDTERDFGLDIYDRMLHDPSCAAAINSIKVGVLSEGPRFVSPVPVPSAYRPDPAAEAAYAKSLEVRDVIEAMFDALNSPVESIIGEMFQFLPFGHCIAEKVYAEQNGLLALKKLTVKPRTAYAFCSDVYLNMPGFIAAKLGGLMMLTIPTNVEPNDIIREKSSGCSLGIPTPVILADSRS